MLPLRGSFDVVAFVSEPDSMISPSEGVDGDLDLRDAMVILPGSLRDPGDVLKDVGWLLRAASETKEVSPG